MNASNSDRRLEITAKVLSRVIPILILIGFTVFVNFAAGLYLTASILSAFCVFEKFRGNADWTLIYTVATVVFFFGFLNAL